jgi:hypothetical protein
VRQLLVRQSRHRRGRVSGIICEGRSSGRGGILCSGLLDSRRRRRRGRDARSGCSSFGGRGRVDGSIRGGFVPRWRSSHGRSGSEGRCCKSLACGQYLARLSIRAILRARALARGSGSSSVVSRHPSYLRVILAGALARAFGLLVIYSHGTRLSSLVRRPFGRCGGVWACKGGDGGKGGRVKVREVVAGLPQEHVEVILIDARAEM